MKKILFCAALICAATLVACGGGNKSKVTMGSLTGDFDSLSYSLGANIGYGLDMQLKDVPFDFDRVAKGIEDGAFEKSTVPHDKALEMLRTYLMTKRGPRAMELAQKHAAADSARMAAGDSTKVEYPADPSMFENDAERDSISYAFGVDIGHNVLQSGMPIQIVWLQEAMKDVREKSPRMPEEEVNKYLQYYFMVKMPKENAEASQKWLEKIEKKSGVKKTESGLLYKITQEGDANVIAKDDRDMVEVEYKGMTREGKVFDASRLADKPEEMQKMIKQYNPEYKDEPTKIWLNRVVKGWTEGLKLVGKGGKITLWIPSELAYGANGGGRLIGPNEALQFDIEVVNVTPYVEPAPAPAVDSTAVAAPVAPATK